MRKPKPKSRPEDAQQPTQLSPSDKFRLVDSSDPMVQALETNEGLRDALMLQLIQRFKKSTSPTPTPKKRKRR
jgi:hypothetical protein